MRIIPIISFIFVLIVALAVTSFIFFRLLKNSPSCHNVCNCTSNELHCDRRKLNAIPLIGRENFTDLDLSGNNIIVIDDNIFQNGTKVLRINLNDNNITTISPKAFQGPENLQTILLKNNLISSLPNEIFTSHIHSLKSIDLSKNRLSSLPTSLEKLTRLEEINLLDNPLNCDCEMRFFAFNLKNNRMIKVQAKCEHPMEFHNKNLTELQPCNKVLKKTDSLPQITNQPQNVRVPLGREARFDCQISDLNKTEIQWVLPFEDDKVNYYSRNQTLIIQDIGQKHEDTSVTCIATNSQGSVRLSAKIYISKKEEKKKRHTAAYNETQPDLSDPCEQAKLKLNETLNHALTLIKSVANETTNVKEIQNLLRRPNKAARILAKINDEREKFIEIYTQLDQICKASSRNFNKSVSFKLTPQQLTIYSQAFGCSGSLNSVPCSERMCFHKKYRSIDGKCNNLKNPDYGSAVSSFHRLLKPEYEDGLYTPIGWNLEKDYFGFPKPSARVVSSNLLRANKVLPDPNLSVMVMQWGQFLDHDLDFTPQDPAFSRSGGGLACNDTCTNDRPCFPILVPPGDVRIKKPCIGFSRSLATCGSGDTSLITGFQYREQVNQITSFIDASNVYGSSIEEADNLRNRTNAEGKLRVGVPTKSGKYLLPFNVNGMIDCQKDHSMKYVECFKAGDHRSNENLGLLAMHTMWVREHNRLAEELKSINSHWKEDKIYFEARKIVGALMQKITYHDWLPVVLGDGMEKLGAYQGYNDSVNPTVSNVFAAAAMRFGHTLINPFVYRLDKNFKEIPEKHLPLHKAFFAPIKIIEDGGIDPILRGLFAKASKNVRPEQPMNTEIIEKLFTMAHEIALDLGALNIQRARDHGIPSYNSWREFCGLPKAETFDDFATDIPSDELREKMREVYGHPGNVDLFAGGVLEKKASPSIVGPTFNCLLVNQFKRSRDGDRFFYENPGQFTKEQLQQLNSGSLSRIVCDNGDNIDRVQQNIFLLPKSEDEFINCTNIPKIDLFYWKETENMVGSSMTNGEDECTKA